MTIPLDDVKKIIDRLSYWQTRCELAERYIQSSPCDPDITTDQLANYSLWKSSVALQSAYDDPNPITIV